MEELLRNADVAMYMAKERGKGTYQVFEPAMHDTALKRLELKADLQRAIEYEEYRLHFQPVIELGSGRIAGVEALIRWIHPVRGLVPPLEFIPHLGLGYVVFRLITSSLTEATVTMSGHSSYILDGRTRLTDYVLRVVAKSIFYFTTSIPIIVLALALSPRFEWVGLLAVVLAAVGVVFGGATYLLRRLGPAIAGHALYNAAVLAIVLLLDP